ncbi:MAG: exodeoxyribonuclease V subunit gamma [Chitinispirillia bacterium]|nr:exodeoxyribonuclease V subunit gamma [Chitinispirillia bacterium]MCL2242196.1 exodeoxyribonuclease V subunit gamma [Chitinispirillia bacterium]
MLNLIFAPSADALVPLVVERIRGRGAWADPFDPPAVIVPNPAVGKWLSVKLAESPSFGCVANARMPTLEKFLWGALLPGCDMKMLDGGRMAMVICALLDEKQLAEGIYSPLRSYLIDKGDGRIDALKRVQLSARIAQLFLEYEYNRPSVWDESAAKWRRLGIDAQWLSGRPYFDGPDAKIHEEWQRDLYCKVDRCFNPADYTTLPHLYRQRRQECAKDGRPWCGVGSNKQVFLFGVSKISHFHRNTLVEMSQTDGVEMHVFLTNPCAEFWEDVDTRRWNSRSPAKEAGIKPVRPEDYNKEELDQLGLFGHEEDHALLKLWGSAGKENIYLWCPQAEWNFEYHCSDGGGPDSYQGNHPRTLLAALQKSLLSRVDTMEPISGNIADDRTLQILACPDAGREVEELREMVLDLAFENGVGDFSDIAVYLPDPDKYSPHIQRVFGAYPPGHAGHIPFSILGATCGASFTARGLFVLLGIAEGEFNRARVFELLRNPIVRAGQKISSREIETWERWAGEQGMFRGFDAAQRESMGDAGGAATDEHTFGRGLARIFEAIDTAGDGVIPCDSILFDIFQPEAQVSDVRKTAEKFKILLEKLNELSAQFTRDSFLPAGASVSREQMSVQITDAVESVRKAVWWWFGDIPQDGSVDGIAEARVRQEAVSGLDSIIMQQTLAKRESIGSGEFIELVRGCVPEELSVPSSAWHGITFAPLRSSAVLPHRAIFALGLDAAAFPGTNDTSGWNLLSSKRIVGDSDKVRDNRFAFLELMHAARERLVLMFRARDMQKDEVLQPSSVILELEEYLKSQGVVDADSRECLVRREIPWIVYESLDAARERGRGHGTWDGAQRNLALKSSGERVRHRHELAVKASVKSTPPPDDAGLYTASLYDLKRFFGNPLEYHLYKTLGIMDDDDPGDMAAVNEPIETGWMLLGLRKRVWIAVLNRLFSDDTGTDPVQSAIETAKMIYGAHVDSGQAPEGHIRRMEESELLTWARRCTAVAAQLREVFPNHRVDDSSIFMLDSCKPFIIEIKYALTIAPNDPNDKTSPVGMIAFDRKCDPANNPGLWIDGVTRWIGEGGNRPVALIALNHDETPAVKSANMKIDPDMLPKMTEWLAEILKQMLIERRCEYLPFKAVAEIVKTKKKEFPTFGECMDGITENGSKPENLKTALRDMVLGNTGYNPYLNAFNLTDERPAEMPAEELYRFVKAAYEPMLGRWIHE